MRISSHRSKSLRQTLFAPYRWGFLFSIGRMDHYNPPSNRENLAD